MRVPLIIATFALGVASAATFAGFNIKPNGEQKLNLQTGTTVLPKGGTATDSERGVTVDARYIEFKDGEWLKATDAKLTTKDGGTLTARNVEYQTRNALLQASGDLRYNDKHVQGLTANTITLDTTRKLGVAVGNVSSAEPQLAANTVIVDYANNRAVMFGNYKYTFGKTRLASAKPDAVLLVTWNDQGQPKASTKPTPEQLQPYQAYLK